MSRLIALSLLVAASAPAAPLRLAEALERATARSPEARSALAPVAIARAEVRTAGMLANPTLSVLGAQTEPRFSASLAARLPLLGQRGLRVRAAERGVAQAEAEAALSVWRLRHDARLAYYTAARADEEVAIALRVEELTRQVAAMAKERLDVGAGTRLDEEQSALLHVRAQQDVSDRRAAARVARLELARLLGLPAGGVGALGDPLASSAATPPVEELLAGARRAHPELKALGAERQAALARASSARGELRPYPTLEVGIDLLEPTTCDPNAAQNGSRCVGLRGALSFDLPLLNLNGGPVARATAEARAAELKAEAALLRVDAAVRAAAESLAAAQVRARFYRDDYLPRAERVEAMAREGFTAGRTGLLPLLEAERAYLDARLGEVEALFSVQSARADLELSSGVPLDAP